MARAIDADRLADGLKLHRQPTDQKHEADRQWAVGYNAGLDRALHSIAYAPTLTPPNEWVSVEERLPEVGQEVLVYWRNTSQKAEHFELTHYDGDHWFLLDNTERPWIVVVAWMPLPAPYDRRPPEGEA